MGNLLGIVVEFLADGHDDHLLGGEPEGELAGGVLDEYGNETLHRTERRTVNHHRAVFLVVVSGIFEFETFGQVVVDLYGSQLPAATDGIFDHEVELGTVKGSFAVFDFGFQAFFFTSLNDSLFGSLPVFFATDVFFAVYLVAQ